MNFKKIASILLLVMFARAAAADVIHIPEMDTDEPAAKLRFIAETEDDVKEILIRVIPDYESLGNERGFEIKADGILRPRKDPKNPKAWWIYPNLFLSNGPIWVSCREKFENENPKKAAQIRTILKAHAARKKSLLKD